MALLIHIKKGKKLIINGAVLENVSERTISFLLKNEVDVLRCDDVLAPDEAATPAGRIYYALQCLYLFPNRRECYLPVFSELIEIYRQAAPSMSKLIDDILCHVRAGQFYEALKHTRELIRHEGRSLALLAEDPDAGADSTRVPAAAAPRRPVLRHNERALRRTA